MREPSLPSNTCPAIDEVQEGIRKASDAIDEAADFLNGLAKDLEDLRYANSKLRECAEYWQSKYEELDAANDEQAYEIQNLKDQVKDLHIEINSLERELS